MSAERVLVVDDDPGIRIAIAVKLRGAGLEVLEACDGLEGLEIAQREALDLIIADVGMPRMDGYEMAREIHALGLERTPPVIFVTAQDLELPAGIQAGIGEHEFLTKPFSPRELLHRARAWIECGGGR